MAHQKERRFYIVKDRDNMQEPPFQDDSLREMEKEKRRHKGWYRKLAAAGIIAAAIALAVLLIVSYLKTYTGMHVSATYKIGNVSNNSYKEFADGVLKRSEERRVGKEC